MGVLMNAVICGVLAFPYDRFQVRVIWLLPLAALLASSMTWEQRRRLKWGSQAWPRQVDQALANQANSR